MKEIVFGLKDIKKVAKEVLQYIGSCKVVTFSGPLGAGKTTLIREIFKQLGIKESVTSPTFTYMNVYRDKKGRTLYHFDLYRINDIKEFYLFGFDEFLFSEEGVSFIEWPELLIPILKDNVCKIKIDYFQGDKRKLEIVGLQ